MIWEMIAFLHVYLLTGLCTEGVCKETWVSWARGTHHHLTHTHSSQPGRSSAPVWYLAVHPSSHHTAVYRDWQHCYNSSSVLAALEEWPLIPPAGDTEHYSFGDSAIVELSAPFGCFEWLERNVSFFPRWLVWSVRMSASSLQFALRCWFGPNLFISVYQEQGKWQNEWLLDQMG